MQITLNNGIMTAVINTYGAELKSLKDSDGFEYIWDGSDASYWNRSAPFLFPNVGKVPGGKTIIKGQEYELPQHGFCRDMEWEAVQVTPFSAFFTLRSNEETLKKFPFAFTVVLKYILEGRNLKMEFEVNNTGDEEMMYCFGTHPAILVPFQNSPGSGFEDYSVIFECPEERGNPLYSVEAGAIDLGNRGNFMADSRTINLKYDVFEAIDTIIYDKVDSRKVTLHDNNTGKELVVRYGNMDMIAFWTPRSTAPFLCVEPWQGCSTTVGEDGTFADKFGVQTLAPFSAKTFTLEIEPLK
ncbi:MAG: aldose 1-epimerase family protein [Oscillospiraceae bacterium]|nr:aldose 1-epimerase family protein [Oscillospiraceae bacterium]